uniref:ATP-dependent DNA helicase n=2 Tax=Zea mays TaxID=4577 RepID=A0A804N674_MAIZE
MDQMGYNADRTPFTNISNTIITGNQNESNSLGPIVDARERKRQRDRERYAAMTVEQKNEKNRKRREARQRNKGLPIKTQSSIDSFPDDCSTIDFKILSTQGIAGGDEQVNVDPDDDSDWLHRNETFQANNIVASNDLLTTGCVHESVDNTPNHTMKRAAYFSERYKNLTPVERESRRERLRLYNKTPRRKDAKTEYGRKRRALQSDTFNQESIAMEDPTYTPEVGRHRTDATQPYGSSVTTCDWVIPEFVGTPFLPTSIQTEDVGSLTMSTEPLSRKHHVLSGARPAILGSRNQQFEAAISRNVATVTEDTISDAVEGDDWTQPHTTTEIHNNVQCTNPCQGATLATNVSEGMAEQRVQHTHTKPKVISDGDDDEGVIFEEDDDDNDGYLFAGQYDETDEDIKIDGTQDESIDTDLPDTYNKVYSNMPEETHMLKSVPNCGYCNAKKFEYEPPGFCCRGGKVELAPLETPPQLWRLWDSADSDARHFRDNIRFFNGHFSFTSLYCCLDSKTTNVRDSGIYTFRAQGMMYHNIKSFGREGGAEHKHLELYFYDDDPNLEHRYRMCREEHQQKDKDVIKQIVSILRENPYSEHLRSMGHVENLDDYRITLNLDQSLNQ